MFKITRLFTKAILRKIVLPRVRPEFDALVVSPGGVATTMVMEQIAQYCHINDPYDRDGLKHLPRPAKKMFRDEFLKVLFISGDVDIISQSLLRRGWLRIQAARLACPSAVLLPPELSKQAFARCVERQRYDWEMMATQNILVVEFEDIWDRLQEIADHLGIEDSDFVVNFRGRRPRQTEGGRKANRE